MEHLQMQLTNDLFVVKFSAGANQPSKPILHDHSVCNGNSKVSFSLLVLLLGSEGHWTLDRSALITPYRAVVRPRESGADTN